MAKLLLKAVEHNWGLICPWDGTWLTKTWKIYDDGSYEIDEESYPIRSVEEYDRLSGNELRKTVHRKKSGKMKPKAFDALYNAITFDPWRDPEIESGGCDGVGWEIEQFDADGNVVRTTGDVGYIYGHENLERIVSCLPKMK